MKNYYAILGAPSTATPAEIDAAFRSLAREVSPGRAAGGRRCRGAVQIGDRGARSPLLRRKTPGVRPISTPTRRRVPVSEGPFPTRTVKSKPTVGQPRGLLDIEGAIGAQGGPPRPFHRNRISAPYRGGVASGARGGQPRPIGRNVHLYARAMPFLRRTGWCGLPDVRGRGNGHRTSPCASATPARVRRWDSAPHPRLRSSSIPGWPQGRSLSSCARAAVLVTRQLERQPVLLDFPVQCPHA